MEDTTVLYNFLIYLQVQHKQIEFQLERDAFHRIWLKLVLEWTFKFHHVLTIWLLSPLRGRNDNSFECTGIPCTQGKEVVDIGQKGD